MGVLKLESFSHDTEIRKGIAKFESFDSLRQQSFKEGVKSGADAATSAFEAEKLRTLSPILEALNDLSFAQSEARHALMASLQPMIDTLVASVLPECAAQGLAAEISGVVARACEKSPHSQIIIHVAPDAVSAIQAMLAPAKADFTVEPDASLDALHVKIGWHGGYDEINLDAALKNVRAAVHNFFTIPEKTEVQNA